MRQFLFGFLAAPEPADWKEAVLICLPALTSDGANQDEGVDRLRK